MKRINSLAFALIILMSVTAFSKNQVNTIDIDAVLYKDGSMYVTQVWEGNFEEGTELYISSDAADYIKITDLQVADGNGVYETIENWNKDGSFAEKANKCGIIFENEEYEICFGISRYGKNRYSIEYKLSDVVGEYSDKDGLKFRFVKDGRENTPTDVKVEVRLADGTPLNEEDADVLGFGYEGAAEFSDGAALVYTKKPIGIENHVTVLLSLKKGILSPRRQESGSFENMKRLAILNGGFDENGNKASFFVAIATTIIGAAILVLLLLWVRKASKGKSDKNDL